MRIKQFAMTCLPLYLLGCAAPATLSYAPDGVPSTSSPIALSPDGGFLWVVNPDADSITRVDTGSLEAAVPIPVGREPWAVAVTPSGQVVVMNRLDGTLGILEQSQLVATIEIGPEPGGLALSPSGALAYVTVSSSDEVVTVDLKMKQVTKRFSVGHLPWAIAVTDDGDNEDDDETIVVTHRRARLRPGGKEATDEGKEGWLSVIRGDDVQEISLPPYAFGFTNGLEGLAVTDDAVLVSHLLNQPEAPRDFKNTVSAAVSTVSLTTGQELSERRLHLNEATFSTPVNFPRAIVLSPNRKTAYVVLAGSDAVMGIDLSNPAKAKLLGFWQTGKNPRGIVLNQEGSRAFVVNYLSRDVSVLDLTDTSKRLITATISVAPETLEPELLRGKVLFNKANDPKLSHLGWLSCASCHLDGGVDGTTWLSPDGPRQTQPLWNLAGTAPFHASATRDEVQDAELDIETLLDGIGLAPGVANPELGELNGDTSNDLDSLASFVLTGIRVPRAPTLTPHQEARGREVFFKAGCHQCHSGASWTISALPAPPGSFSGVEVSSALRDVGTTHPDDVLGQQGFDVPTLLGLGSSAPYLHDGSAQSLAEVLKNLRHAPPLTEVEAAELIVFLNSIDGDTKLIQP